MIKKALNKTLENISHKWDQIDSHATGGKGKVKVTCFGGAEQVTGSNFLIEFNTGTSTKRMLIDCGLPQGLDAEHKQWEPLGYDTSAINYLFVTHAHMDHIGRIPFLKASGFNGKIYSTKPTRDMAQVAFKDAFHIMTKDYDKGFMEKLPYKERDIEASMALWKTVDYRQTIKIDKNLSVTFFNSSHVLGSAFIQIDCDGEKFLFTGDMGKNSLLLPEADIPTDSDIVFMETVYGNRYHENVEERQKKLLQSIKDEINNKGTLVIAAFAIERTQEVLKEINDFIETKQIPKIPVFLDSPLAIDVTKIFKKYEDLFNPEMQEHINHGDDIFRFPGLHFTESHDESIAINDIPGPKIIIAGSGMIAGGRVVHHVRKYISNPKNTILLAGYQAIGTYGRLLAEGKKNIIFYGEPFEVNAKIKQLSGYSAHRDKEGLLEFVDVVRKNCKSLNLILGDNDSLIEFRQAIYERFGIRAHICLKKEVLDF
jgi:metallo-beta-lactamase family protein